MASGPRAPKPSNNSARSPRKITRAYIAAKVDAAEANLERCWSLLDYDKGVDADLLLLQPLLVQTLHSAETVYREIANEQKTLVSKKPQLSGAWFKRRMATLDHYSKCIKIILGIGRMIGDAFAWIFYRDEDDLLRQHLRIQRQSFLPPGVGGFGERTYLERFQNTAGTPFSGWETFHSMIPRTAKLWQSANSRQRSSPKAKHEFS
jgi:hypothetical protein